MARRTETVNIEGEDNRDAGKSFLITEMSAENAEWWAFRVMQALLGSDADIKLDAPLAQVAAQGLRALGKLDPAKAKPLLDEMMGCVQVNLPDGGVRKLFATDIEEVSTRIRIRKEILDLHVGFFTLGGE